jgi:hypothetical protein
VTQEPHRPMGPRTNTGHFEACMRLGPVDDCVICAIFGVGNERLADWGLWWRSFAGQA